jgi:hypothetical protein
VGPNWGTDALAASNTNSNLNSGRAARWVRLPAFDVLVSLMTCMQLGRASTSTFDVLHDSNYPGTLILSIVSAANGLPVLRVSLAAQPAAAPYHLLFI